MTLVLGNGKKGTFEMTNVQIGIVNCLRLHIHEEPNLESNVACKIRYLSEVAIDLDSSTEDFYKVCTVAGIEGFCQKDLVTIK